MSKTVQWKRGNSTVNSNYVGAEGEITVNIDNWNLHVHDGLTPGGYVIDSSNGGGSFGNMIVTGNITTANLAVENLLDANIIITTGNVTGSYFIGNGSLLTGITSYTNSDVISLGEVGWAGNIIPAANATYSLGNITNQWANLWVADNTIYLGNVALGVAQGNLLTINGQPVLSNDSNVNINTQGDITAANLFSNIVYLDGIALTTNAEGNLLVNGSPVSTGPIQPYIELTNSPFISLPAILGNAVTITAEPIGNNARFDVNIGAGPVIDSVSVLTAGNGYTVGQRYRVLYYDIGGSSNADDIEFIVANVNETGGITTIANVQFMGNATNSPDVYTNKVADYLPSVFDTIDTGLTLTRDRGQGIYNSDDEQEYDNSTYLSPLGTEWNNDGWGDLLSLNTRSYVPWRAALNNQVGNNIVGAELVMHDTINDKYYKFSFTEWGQNNGNYAYTRELVTDPNYFRKEDYGDQVDIIVPDDGEGSGIGITRGNNNGIYNPFREEEWDENVSPAGTLWNTDGWDDLSNITTRTYDNFYAAYGGGLGNKVPGSRAVMYVPDTGKYYAIEWFTWTQGAAGGGFSYSRKELNLDQLNEGVKFADGTILKSAEGVGRVKATASGDRRIEEVTGNKTVSVSQRITTNLNTVASRAGTNTLTIWIDSTASDIANIIANPANYNNAYGFEFSLDDTNWYAWTQSTSFSGNERGYSIANTVTYLQGDTVYFRYKTGGESVVWWDKADLPGGSGNFRGAIIDYHAYSGEATWIGTIHIVDDTGNDLITHTEVNSGSADAENDDLWIVEQEGQIRYRRIDGEAKTLKVQWIAKVFYGSEYYD